ncbi:MAG: hypothetical protein ACXW27_03255 [Allosphingosinicella sp.]
MDRKLITPAEAVLLLAPATGTATKCIQAGLLSLLGAERIAFEKSSSLFKQSALLLNPPSRSTALPLPKHLVALERALVDHGEGGRLVSSEVLGALQKRFGHGFGRYLRDEVAPGLIERKLLSRRDSKWLGLFPRIIYQRTSSGDALAAPLQRLMSAVEQIPSLLTTDPDQALRLARSAGVLLVMSPKARRQIPKLRKLLADRGDDVPALVPLPMEDRREPEWEQIFELGDMALEFDVASLFEGLETVGDFTSGGDSSSSDGGDGGGGD